MTLVGRMELELGADGYFVPPGVGLGEVGLPECSAFEGEAKSGGFGRFEVLAGGSDEGVWISLNHL